MAHRLVELFSAEAGVAACLLTSGREALDALAEGCPYSVVFMDWVLPDMDGLECTRQIRAIEDRRGGHVPVVAMTGNVLPEHRLHAK